MKYIFRLQFFEIIFFLVSVLTFAPVSYAKYQIELTPSISISEQYDDNITLVNTGEKSDYITTISPGIFMEMVSEKGNLTFMYSPSVVRYLDEDQYNTIRHSAAVTMGEELSRYLRFDFSDTFLRSEEPIEETEGIEGIRRTRNVYKRNNARASMRYIFGRENSLDFGCGHSILKNDDITLDDTKKIDPFAELTYWFDIKNGLELRTGYTVADFSSDDNSPPADDYSGPSAGARYIHRFNPQTSGFVDYNFTDRNFDGPTEDYNVHDVSLGFDHDISSQSSVSASGGYFIQKNAYSDDKNGFTYNLAYNRSIERGRLSIGGNGGWHETFLDAENRGFTRYWGLNSRFQYQVLERLSNYAAISYRKNKDATNVKRTTIRADYGWIWSFARWYSLELNYSCSARDSDLAGDDYDVNRVMLSIDWKRPFQK